MIQKCTNKYIWITFVVICLVASSQVIAQQWGPLISTNWYQGDHFNRKCPLLQPGSTGRCAVGCTATAMAQIINMWEYPTSVQFNPLPWPQGDAYTSTSMENPVLVIDIDGDAVTHDFPELAGDRPGMLGLNTALARIDYTGDQEEEAYLCFGVGIKVRMRYGSQSGAFLSASAYRNGFDYGSAMQRDSILGLWPAYEEKVIENMKKGWPIQMGVTRPAPTPTNPNWRVGHSVIVDGYRESDGYFHVNLGWGGELRRLVSSPRN